MSLNPYEPFRQLEDIRREFERFFTNGSRTGIVQNFANPSIDVYETEKEVVVRCDIPGLENKEDVTIDIDNNHLLINGTINRINDIQEEHFHRKERYYGRFQRSIPLPARVFPAGVKATYKNGVLEIRMPKTQSDTRKRIDIDFH